MHSAGGIEQWPPGHGRHWWSVPTMAKQEHSHSANGHARGAMKQSYMQVKKIFERFFIVFAIVIVHEPEKSKRYVFFIFNKFSDRLISYD